MATCNSSRTLVDTESKMGDDGDPVSDPTLYRSLVGSLQYLTFTRPDISYAVQLVCLYMHDPRKPHFSSLKRILWYVRGTLDYGLQLFSSSTTDLVAYSDADWTGCPTTGRSTSVPRQRSVANVVAETCWLRNLLHELHTPLSSATLVYCGMFEFFMSLRDINMLIFLLKDCELANVINRSILGLTSPLAECAPCAGLQQSCLRHHLRLPTLSSTPTLSQTESSVESSITQLLFAYVDFSLTYVTDSDSKEEPEEYEDDVEKVGVCRLSIDGGEDGDDDDGDSSGDDADDEEEEEDNPAPAISRWLPVSLSPEAEVERLLAMPTPPSSPPSAGERLARTYGGRGIDYGFVSTVDTEARRQGISEVGYGIMGLYALLRMISGRDRISLRMQQAEMAALRETGRRRQAQMTETLRVMRDMRREMSDMHPELLAHQEQQRRARQPGPDARIPDHQDAFGDADSHI
ncbi:ribonuclease H-like domain-containing protein [Tanacetum coccineum]